MQRRNVGVESCVTGDTANVAPSSVFYRSLAWQSSLSLDNTQVCELQSLSLVDPRVAIELYMNY